ncbi:TetR/AcrR family transcriptional regulator [Arvimicrobium flavum]|uniref:TetR/AcrR family transcriptional regulator n=1 Tax=Arvimicrobium flavum TaxID=3393320 RepID=UPI00237BB9BF|nr:TetR/AcrR family transcriptional regulator [Mesorhizobium shangrilense]
MSQPKGSSRDRILAAAAEVAREAGAGKLSLDAIAARAGVSKGGLLYNFPTKAALMRALVDTFLAEFEAELNAATEDPQANVDVLTAYVRLSAIECEETKPGGAGVLAAIAEDPDFLKPIAAFKRRLLDRLKANAADVESVLVIYLALEGMRSMKLFEIDVLTADERELAVAAMLNRFARG